MFIDTLTMKLFIIKILQVVVDKFIDGLRIEAVQLEVRRGQPKHLEEGELVNKAVEARCARELKESRYNKPFLHKLFLTKVHFYYFKKWPKINF